MAKWAGWIAALGGLIALASPFIKNIAFVTDWGAQIGGVIAILFGIWAALQ